MDYETIAAGVSEGLRGLVMTLEEISEQLERQAEATERQADALEKLAEAIGEPEQANGHHPGTLLVNLDAIWDQLLQLEKIAAAIKLGK